MAKKYFFLKLEESFFENEEVKNLRLVAGGDTYTVILLKLYLISLKTEGKLEFEGMETAKKLALKINEKPDNVEIVLTYMIQKNLAEILSESEICLNYIQENIGSECESAKRVRKMRKRRKEENENLQETKNIKSQTDIEFVRSVIDYLNTKTGTHYRAEAKETQRLILARKKEGFRIEDFYRVIDKKVESWSGTEWEKFLRPQTLFGTKFESYLNEKGLNRASNKTANELDQFYQMAKEFAGN